MTTSRIARQQGKFNDYHHRQARLIHEDALLGSGADTGCLGMAFKIMNKDSLRTINVYGCRDEFVTKGLKIGDGITLASDPSGEKFILRYNEGIIDPDGKSIFSVAQLRNHRIDVEDKPKVYGEKQQLETLEGVILPLNIKGGLAHLTIQYPTDADIQSYPMIEITSDLPWSPEGLDSEGDRFIQEVKVEQEGPNLELISPCLGWEPVEIVKRTLESTT